ncbi:MAG: GDSL-type esterase/lipase family protein [Candidatus Sumerlaeales bacterium]|nr:GDSL-type esterase/lipase family protein [Candidatus Sumerlaeales bacterium]
MNSIRVQLSCFVVVALSLCVSPMESYSYQADDASTPTLWAIKDVSKRVKADTDRRGDYYGNRMKTFLNETIKPGGIVFVGDSITNRFPLDECFPNGLKGKPVYNRGIGGDRIEGVLERLDVSVTDLAPSELHVMIGTNDVLWPVDYKNGNLKPGFERLFKSLKSVAPQAKIYAYSIMPIDKEQDRVGTCIKDVVTANKQLADVCKAEGVEFVNMYPKFATAEGNFKSGLSVDGVHLSKAGYLNWLDFVVKDKDTKFDMWKAVADKWTETSTVPVSGINVYRNEDMLIVYQADKNSKGTTTTATNAFGTEALVQNGVVTKVSAKGSMPVPENPSDYVLSGHGKMHEWVKANCLVGARVKLSADKKSVSIERKAPTEIKDWYVYLRSELLAKMANNKNEESIKACKELANEIESIRPNDADNGQKVLRKIDTIK